MDVNAQIPHARRHLYICNWCSHTHHTRRDDGGSLSAVLATFVSDTACGRPDNRVFLLIRRHNADSEAAEPAKGDLIREGKTEEKTRKSAHQTMVKITH